MDIINNLTYEEQEKLKLLLNLIPNVKVEEVVTLRFGYSEYKAYAEANLSEKSRMCIDTSFRHLLRHFSEHKILRDIGIRECENFFAELKKPAPSGYRVYYRTLKAAFNKFVDWGYIATNPILKIKLPKQQKLKPVFIGEEELNKICEHIDLDVVRDISQLSFYTGLRLSECINLRWVNIDLQNKLLNVGDEQFITKARKVRVVPLCEQAYEIIQKRFENTPPCPANGTPLLKEVGIKSGYVFAKGNGERFTGDHISKRWKKGVRAAGMDGKIHFHTLRHSFASNLVQRGVPLYSVKELLGHSSLACTEIYSHLDIDSLREAINKL
ncbi:MAG: tyrosine-type recombinase/integrase [Bacteroidetes bacterium]|nr:tyrosine-type recombinase/integrase [Bacteroidota bacterium]